VLAEEPGGSGCHSVESSGQQKQKKAAATTYSHDGL
jgi:hypothetical protein